MRVLSQAEIARCTKSELHALMRVIASELPYLPENSPELPPAESRSRSPLGLEQSRLMPAATRGYSDCSA